MSQKENDKINKQTKKKFKNRFRSKGDKTSEYSGYRNIAYKPEKNWFTDQYEQLIGSPLPKKELSRDEILRSLKQSAKYRWVPEARSYKVSPPQSGKVHYVEWTVPVVKACTCPNKECTCRGDSIFPRKKIPHGERYYKLGIFGKLCRYFNKPAQTSSQAENFAQRLAAIVGAEAAIHKDLGDKGILNIKGTEFCLSRCMRYYGPSNWYLLDKQKNPSHSLRSSLDPGFDEDKDCHCRGSCCTVSTQSTVGPKGEFIIGNFSHVLYSTFAKTVMKDIEGTLLEVATCRRCSRCIRLKLEMKLLKIENIWKGFESKCTE